MLDGELLVRGAHQGGETGGAASFNALQQRLGRKTVSKAMLRDSPAFVRLYDVLIEGADDLREWAWEQRRSRLEVLVPRLDPERFDIRRANARRHFAFGVGPHFCVGNLLARGELRITIDRLLQRVKNLRLARGEDGVAWQAHFFAFGPSRLEIAFDPL